MSWQHLARTYAAKLTADGAITTALIAEAFAGTPRQVFVPRYWEVDDHNTPSTLIDGALPEHQEKWLAAVYSDQWLITKWAAEGTKRIITSSASQPSIVAHMLERADLRPGLRALEIGLGSGYNAALLCHILGAENVTSVDIDPALVIEAEARLAHLDYQPIVTASDGQQGVPSGAPYDRIIATCASPGIPTAWIDQLADDGRIIAPMTFGGALVVATKTSSTEVVGRIDTEQAYFMAMHTANQAMAGGTVVPIPSAPAEDTRHVGTTTITVSDLADFDFRLWLSLHSPVRIVETIDNDFNTTGYIIHTSTDYAHVDGTTQPDGTCRVTQDQARPWDTVESAWAAWTRLDKPGRNRLGITARTDGVHRIWLDSPDSDHSWPLPTS